MNHKVLAKLMTLLCIQVSSVFAEALEKDKTCSPVQQLTNYKVLKGDHIASILRTLQLEPVFGKNQSLERLLKINNLKNPNLIEPEQELAVPFKCEEQVLVWKTINRTNDRLLVRKNDSFVNVENKEVTSNLNIGANNSLSDSETEAKKIDSNSIAVQDTTNSIIKNNSPTEEIPRKNVDQNLEETPTEVSEALRYRMICDGEWTGTQCVTRYSTVFLEASGWYNRYDGVDPSVTENNQGVLLSRLNPELGAGWVNYWSENIKTELQATMQNSTILPEAREIPIQQKKKFLGAIKAEVRYEFGEWGIGFFLRQYDKQFYRFSFSGLSQPCLGGGSSFAGCGVVISSASVMSYGLDLSYMLLQAGKFKYDLQVHYKQIGTAATGGYQVKNGTGLGMAFRVSHDRIKEYLYGEVSYSKETQSTTIESQTMQNLGFTFGYSWKLKDW